MAASVSGQPFPIWKLWLEAGQHDVICWEDLPGANNKPPPAIRYRNLQDRAINMTMNSTGR
jgi:hypothetical protein